MNSRRTLRRAVSLSIAVAAAIAGGVLLATPASAHVTVSAPGATEGGDATMTFTVPTESQTASTVGLKVQLPAAAPIAAVYVQPKAGWTYTITMSKPSIPVSGDDGAVSQVVSEIDWKVAAGNRGIKPGEFDQFVISAGPLPKQSTLTFKVIQQYSDRSTVSWIEEPAPGSTAEPQHPAPTLSLAPASSNGDAAAGATSATSGTSGTSASGGSSGGTSGVAVVALVVGILALLAAGGAAVGVFSVRRKLAEGASPS